MVSVISVATSRLKQLQQTEEPPSHQGTDILVPWRPGDFAYGNPPLSAVESRASLVDRFSGEIEGALDATELVAGPREEKDGLIWDHREVHELTKRNGAKRAELVGD